jgi:hypothetical protein
MGITFLEQFTYRGWIFKLISSPLKKAGEKIRPKQLEQKSEDKI